MEGVIIVVFLLLYGDLERKAALGLKFSGTYGRSGRLSLLYLSVPTRLLVLIILSSLPESSDDIHQVFILTILICSNLFI